MDAVTIHPCLLDDIKDFLQITWHDDATDRRLSGIIAAGIAYLDGKLGGHQDYTAAGLPRTLLMEYSRYMRDDALEVFEENYLSLIIAAQIGGMADADAET